MAGSLNNVQLIGHLGKDPELRSMQNGDQVCNLSLATSESWRDKQTGEKVEKTEWHRIVIFNQALAKVAGQYLLKGSKVYVQGKLQTRKWQDQAGVDKYTTEVVLGPFNSVLILLDGKDRSGDREPAQTSNNTGTATGNKRTLAEELDDEIPF